MPRIHKDKRGKDGSTTLWGDGVLKGGLTKEQAYHLFYLSHTREGGADGEFPVAYSYAATQQSQKEKVPAVRRIHSWFSDELTAEFQNLLARKVTPLQYYNPPNTITVKVTVETPNRWTHNDVEGELIDIVNNVTGDTDITITRIEGAA